MARFIRFIWTKVLVVEVLILFLSNAVCADKKDKQSYLIQNSRQLSSQIFTEVTAESMIDCAIRCSDFKQCRIASFDNTTEGCRMSEDFVCDVTQADDNSRLIIKNEMKCDSGWTEFNGHCYYFELKSKKTWADVKEFCARFRSYFVKIDDECESNWIKNILLKYADRGVWIGASDTKKEGHMIWEADGSDMTFTDWSPNEPNNAYGNEDCVKMIRMNNYAWNDYSCSAREYFVCEKQIQKKYVL